MSKWRINAVFAVVIIILASSNSGVMASSADGAGSTVVVIDQEGIDVTHPEFSGRVVQEVCAGGAWLLASCPNGQAFQEGKGAAMPIKNVDGGFRSGNGPHGTEVASVAVGKTVGVASGAGLIAIHAPVGKRAAFQWVIDNASKYQISVVVMSVGMVRSATKRLDVPCDITADSGEQGITYFLVDYIKKLREVGIATVIASGNDSELLDLAYPACTTGVVSVGAVTSGTNKLEGYTNSSVNLSLLAPARVKVATVSQNGLQSYLPEAQGTSFAAPYVAGAIAILKSQRPSLSIDESVALLRSTGTPVDDTLVKGIPSVNLQAALNFLATGAPIPSLAATFKTQFVTTIAAPSPTVTVTASASPAPTITITPSPSPTVTITASPSPAPTITITPSPSPTVTITASPAKSVSAMKTIICLKRNLTKKVSAIAPKCPSGYFIKK